MKIIKFFFIILLLPIILLNIYILFTGKWFMYKAIRYNFVNIDDYQLFNNKTIAKSTDPQPWKISSQYNTYQLSDTLLKTHQNLASVAFLVIKNDSIQIENYWDGYNQKSLSNSFSMAKSVVSILIGIAIKEGKINSVDQKVSDYLPEFKKNGKENITIKDLLRMSSGLDWDESKSYKNPLSVFFSDIMEGYYGDDIAKLSLSTKVAEPSGKYFDYKSGDTELLSLILQKATNMPFSEYFQQKLWQPLGAENNALWCTDSKNMEKTFCCLNSNARDFARLGKLYLQKGWCKGVQILDTSYVNESTAPSLLLNKELPAEKVSFYGYQIWLLPDYKGQNIIYFRGTLGQLIILIPEKNILIVRLGKNQGERFESHYAQTLLYIDEVNKLL